MKKILSIIFLLLNVSFLSAQWVDTTTHTQNLQKIDNAPQYQGNVLFEVNCVGYKERKLKTTTSTAKFFRLDSFMFSYSGKLALGEQSQFEFRPGISVGSILMGINGGVFLRKTLFNNLFGCVGLNIFKIIYMGEGSHNGGYTKTKEGLVVFPAVSFGYNFYKRFSVLFSFCYAGTGGYYSEYSRAANLTTNTDVDWIFKIGVEF